MNNEDKAYKKAIGILRKMLTSIGLKLCMDEERGDLYIPTSSHFEDNIWIDFGYGYTHVSFSAYNGPEVSKWDVKGLELFYKCINEVNCKSIAKLVYTVFDNDYVGISIMTEIPMPKYSPKAIESLKFYLLQMMFVTGMVKHEFDKMSDCEDFFDLNKGHVKLAKKLNMYFIVRKTDVLGSICDIDFCGKDIDIIIRFKYQGEEFFLRFNEDDARVILIAENFYSFDRYDEKKFEKVRDTINSLNFNHLSTTSYICDDKQCNVTAKTLILYTDQESFNDFLEMAIFNFIGLKKTFLVEMDYFDYKRNTTNKDE